MTNVNFNFDSEADQKCFMTWKAIVNNGGVWKSEKQAAFLYSSLFDAHREYWNGQGEKRPFGDDNFVDTFTKVEYQMEMRGIPCNRGDMIIICHGHVTGKDRSFGRQMRFIDYFFVIDTYGVRVYGKIGRNYNRDGASCYDAAKTKVEFERDGKGEIHAHQMMVKRNLKRAAAIRERQAVDAQSAFVGEEGDRLDLEVKVEFTKGFDGDYGVSYLNKMRDADGNIFVTFTNKTFGDKGDVVKLRGTVKGHEERDGIRQTKLTRCKVMEKVGA